MATVSVNGFHCQHLCLISCESRGIPAGAASLFSLALVVIIQFADVSQLPSSFSRHETIVSLVDFLSETTEGYQCPDARTHHRLQLLIVVASKSHHDAVR
jgi:hypothetical protein